MSTLIAGLGNVLMGDDAIGPTLVHYLKARYEFADEVELEDLGTPGIDLAQHLANRDTVIVLDAIEDPARPPGTVCRFDAGTLAAARTSTRQDAHAPDLGESLRLSVLHGAAPRRMVLIGVVAASCELGDRMSAGLQNEFEAIVRQVVTALGELQIPMVPRQNAEVPDCWWLR
ncbi:MAG: hydrogenase maturation protease [Acidobacteria bacterium]|nr:hydrogenase maturation protease [Acidobacteriota bacterium]